jgi:hypothetical protein
MLARRRTASGVRLSNFAIASTLLRQETVLATLFSTSGVHGGGGVVRHFPFAFSPALQAAVDDQLSPARVAFHAETPDADIHDAPITHLR